MQRRHQFTGMLAVRPMRFGSLVFASQVGKPALDLSEKGRGIQRFIRGVAPSTGQDQALLSTRLKLSVRVRGERGHDVRQWRGRGHVDGQPDRAPRR